MLNLEAQHVMINGGRFLRFSDESLSLPAAVLVHEQAVDAFAAVRACAAMQRAPIAEWQVISRSGGALTTRMLVPGGWVVKHSTPAEGLSLCFVPDPKRQWILKVTESL